MITLELIHEIDNYHHHNHTAALMENGDIVVESFSKNNEQPTTIDSVEFDDGFILLLGETYG